MSLEFNDKQQEEIDTYLQNTLSKEALISFEKKMQENTLFKEEVLLYKSLQQSFNKNDWNSTNNTKLDNFQSIKNNLKSEEFQDISKNIRAVENTYLNTNKSKKSTFYKLAMAASILVFLAIGLPSLFNNSLNDYYNEYENWNEIPSLTEKGTQNEAQKIEELYASKNYNALITLYETNIDKEYHDYNLMQIGHTYTVLENTEKAIQVFDKLIASKKLSSSKGHWYKLLIYLKLHDKVKIKQQLDVILQDENNYKYEEALYLAKEIK